jgi:Fur family ferric uptake transcriptional regulator
LDILPPFVDSTFVIAPYNACMTDSRERPAGTYPVTAVSEDDGLIQPMCAIFRRFLKRQGLKFTTERAFILDAVLSKQGVFEADELLAEMKDAEHRVSKATIYRTLKHLLEAKIIKEVLIDSSRAHYQLAFGRKATGHLVCMETNQIIEFPTEELNALMERVCKEHGYDPLSHRFVIYGSSPAAKATEQAEVGDEG